MCTRAHAKPNTRWRFHGVKTVLTRPNPWDPPNPPKVGGSQTPPIPPTPIFFAWGVSRKNTYRQFLGSVKKLDPNFSNQTFAISCFKILVVILSKLNFFNPDFLSHKNFAKKLVFKENFSLKNIDFSYKIDKNRRPPHPHISENWSKNPPKPPTPHIFEKPPKFVLGGFRPPKCHFEKPKPPRNPPPP